MMVPLLVIGATHAQAGDRMPIKRCKIKARPIVALHIVQRSVNQPSHIRDLKSIISALQGPISSSMCPTSLSFYLGDSMLRT